MKQLPRHALLESLANTAAGFVVSNLAWPLISVHLLHKPYRAVEGLAVVTVFTALSIARNYLVRRGFDHIHHRGLENGKEETRQRERLKR
jgi:hypothetical protein